MKLISEFNVHQLHKFTTNWMYHIVNYSGISVHTCSHSDYAICSFKSVCEQVVQLLHGRQKNIIGF